MIFGAYDMSLYDRICEISDVPAAFWILTGPLLTLVVSNVPTVIGEDVVSGTPGDDCTICADAFAPVEAVNPEITRYCPVTKLVATGVVYAYERLFTMILVAAPTLGVDAVKTVGVAITSVVALGTDVIVPVKDAGVVPNPLTVMLSPIARECAPVNAIVTFDPDTDVPVPVIRGFLFVVE